MAFLFLYSEENAWKTNGEHSGRETFIAGNDLLQFVSLFFDFIIFKQEEICHR